MRFSATRWHTRTCRAFQASRQFAASRPPTHLTLSGLDRQDRKSTTRADLLQRPRWCCMSGQGQYTKSSLRADVFRFAPNNGRYSASITARVRLRHPGARRRGLASLTFVDAQDEFRPAAGATNGWHFCRRSNRARSDLNCFRRPAGWVLKVWCRSAGIGPIWLAGLRTGARSRIRSRLQRGGLRKEL
jgi:hypothetical protein